MPGAPDTVESKVDLVFHAPFLAQQGFLLSSEEQGEEEEEEEPRRASESSSSGWTEAASKEGHVAEA